MIPVLAPLMATKGILDMQSMNPTYAGSSGGHRCRPRVAEWLLRLAREQLTAALMTARHPDVAAGAVASIEAVLLSVSGGASLDEALARELSHLPNIDDAVQVLDRKDVEELRAIADDSREHHRKMVSSLHRDRESIIARAKDPAEAALWVETTIKHEEGVHAAAAEVAMYDGLLASRASSWRFEPRPS